MASSSFTNGRIVASGGCSLVFKGDQLIGAYGVSGSTLDQDEVTARHAPAKFG